MGWADDFAQGFAEGFIPAYTARMEREAEQSDRMLEARIEAAQTHMAGQQEQRQKDARLRNQAQTIASATGQGDQGLAYRLLQTYEDPEVVTDMLREYGAETIGTSVDAQTSEALDLGPSRQEIIDQSAGPTVEAAAQLDEVDQTTTELTKGVIREFEGFRESPYFDVNAQRAGYGSDTVTRTDGNVVPVREGMAVSQEDAERDLDRRVNQEFLPSVRNAVGEEAFNQLSPNQKAALTSLAYNYGTGAWDNDLSEVRDAVASGDMAGASRAILARAGDNDGVNTRRRQQEAALFAGGPVPANTPTDSQMQESGMASTDTADPLYNPENDREKGVVETIFTGGPSVDTRFREYMQETGQWEAYQASRSGSLLTDTPVTSYRLNMPANSGVDLDNYIGKSTAEIDQQLIADEGRITEDDRQRINGIREVQMAEENNSNFWNDPSELSEKSDGFLQSFIALTDSNEGRDRALTALEARQSGDTPTSPKDAAFTEFYRNLPNDLSPEERQESFAVFENTWKQSTSSEGQFDIFAELSDRDSVSELTALRTAVNNDPSLADRREQLLNLIDTALDNQNAISEGGYTLDNYRADLVKYTSDLTTGSEEERQAASEWFSTEQPGIVAGLKAAEGAELDIQASSLVDAGVPEEVARLAATDSLDFRANRFGQLNVYNRNTGEIVSQAETRSAAPTGETRDINLGIPTNEDLSDLSDEGREELIDQLSAQAQQEMAALEETLDGGGVETFQDTLASIDVSAALGGPGKVQSGVNTIAAVFGANAPFAKNRRAANALERLQRVTALTMAQAQANQRGSVTLMNEFRANAVGPNELIGIDGALDKFKANYNIINDRVRKMREIGSGRGRYDSKEVTRANLIAEDLTRLRDYYGVLVQTIEEDVPEPSGEDYVFGGGEEQTGAANGAEQAGAVNDKEQTKPTSGGAGRRQRREERSTQAQAIQEAREAISRGVPEAIARQRLEEEGYDPSGL